MKSRSPDIFDNSFSIMPETMERIGRRVGRWMCVYKTKQETKTRQLFIVVTAVVQKKKMQ